MTAVCPRLLAADHVREILAREVFLHQVGILLVHAEVVDGGDVAVHQPAGDLGFAEETLARLLVAREADLDGDRPLDEGIPALVDGSETPGADALEDFVLADRTHHDGLIQ